MITQASRVHPKTLDPVFSMFDSKTIHKKRRSPDATRTYVEGGRDLISTTMRTRQQPRQSTTYEIESLGSQVVVG